MESGIAAADVENINICAFLAIWNIAKIDTIC